ncbi:hypothetical protein COW98_00225 [Candidatus Roizmanbacteria bacterium CG22_combo_CG10-13_8_21_14_all_35_9]|uniref:Glycosyl transferase family 1 domain-containing protein n=4 Tax=Candidatus Roizmaniibacteriota TaxID=1752723 RepID=A0A2M8F3Y1_9BACT|nr:MAG: hypothetical protein COX47_04035 [Candidatus Roizmanbacteria bacterium CG23_combo_of_CG06-09_8_20_14_all_35_49]PIP63137.1 MAG: hypothetical protein COW98_00225 [Candidatus Roizmanbacteria bacterium CG22_combo_CG10-13_8_21_14_all_35_9]PIY70932.1 MAG: hypothetical protein COY88_03030 [Candidatus Roizmanbacteria bacterium CG_4_10_14_0_8_um_filter_35_28]PJC33992.1 MAG: hypothetical protein CO048_01705 [Candidatus Roizmanbacteria bacterium CG_4_9_14_0_2_um_filter_35_15]PJC82528.1 MAG: hypoth
MKKVFVYDPTASDKLSSVRGVGRYLQILKENFPKNTIFTDSLKRISADSVFVNPFYNFLTTPLTLKRITQKQIAIIHDLIPLKYPTHFPAGVRGNINIFLNKLALKNYDLIITDSEASKRDIMEKLQVKSYKIKVIYPCLPKLFTEKSQILNLKSQINPKFQKQNSKRLEFGAFKLFGSWNLDLGAYCMYVGDATWNKNLVNLARAIKIINVTCIFVGKVFNEAVDVASEETLREADCRDNRQSLAEEKYHERQNLPRANHPWQRELKEFFELTKNDRRFIFAGFLPDSDLLKLYQQARLNILASRDEGFGFSFLEAASQGCLSVLSDIPVLKEISDGNALFCDPKNPYDLADKIGEIYFNKNIRNKVGQLAKKRSEFFSKKKFRSKFLKIIS